MLKNSRTAALAAVVLGVSLSFTQAQSRVHQDLNVRLGLKRSEVVEVAVHGDPSQTLYAALRLKGQWTAMRLQRRSVRAPGFRLLAQDAAGSWRGVNPGPVVTMRGDLVGHENSRVAASLIGGGLHARILLTGGQDYWLEPVPGQQTPMGQLHVLYRDQDVNKTRDACGAQLIAGNRMKVVPPDAGGAPGPRALGVAELGCDADFEYFQRWGSVNGVGNRIQSVINTVNLQYEGQVDITHQITTILVRTSASQPYTSTDAVTLLNQFRNEWLANQGSIQRDTAELFTGKEINGGTIGIAWVGAVCTTFGFSMVQSDFNNNFSCATDLSAHELGHNWNAPHCSCTSFTMNPFITCANNFSSGTISIITSFRNSRTCLDSGQQNQPPSANAGADQTIQLPASASLDGTVSDDGLPNPPGQVTTTWSRVSGPGPVTFGNHNAVDTTASFSAAGTYVLRLTADDSALTDSDDVTITVNPSGGNEVTLAFDDLESASGSGGTGWADVWRGSGDARITRSGGAHSGRYHIRLRRSTGMAQREVDLTGASNVKLVFWAKLNSFEGSDQARVRISTNGGSSYATMLTFANGDDDNTYHRYEIELETVSNNTIVRFDADMSGSRDYFYVDDVEFRGVR